MKVTKPKRKRRILSDGVADPPKAQPRIKKLKHKKLKIKLQTRKDSTSSSSKRKNLEPENVKKFNGNRSPAAATLPAQADEATIPADAPLLSSANATTPSSSSVKATKPQALDRKISSTKIKSTKAQRLKQRKNRKKKFTKNLCSWKPADDLALTIGYHQTNDLYTVFHCVEFTRKFTLREVKARWKALRFNSKAMRGISVLDEKIVKELQRKALFSKKEEALLCKIKHSETPDLKEFEKLLQENLKVFYCSRTVESLHNHWQLMKEHQLLPDQTTEIENTSESLTIGNSVEKSNWNVIVEVNWNVGGATAFDCQTLAILRGKHVRFLMYAKEITFGCHAENSSVDADLACEDPSANIAGLDGSIKMCSNGDFYIANECWRVILVDGLPVLRGTKMWVSDQSIVEICKLEFIFQIHFDLVHAVCRSSAVD